MSVTAPNVKLWKIFLQQHLVLHRFPDAAALVVFELFLGQLFWDMGCLTVLSSQKRFAFDLSYNTCDLDVQFHIKLFYIIKTLRGVHRAMQYA